MLIRQLQREKALRSLVWYLPAAVILGVVVQLLVGARDIEPVLTSDEPPGLYPMLLIVWAWLVIFMLNAGVRTRSSGPLDLALPLPARRLWTVHVTAIVAGAIGMLGTVALVVALANAVQGHRPLIQSELLGLGLHLASGFMLTVAVLQSPQPGLYRVPLRGGYAWLVPFGLAAYFVLVLLMSVLPPGWALVPLGVALVLGLRTYRSLPAGFALAGRQPTRALRPTDRSPSEADVAIGPVRARLRLLFAIWRTPVGSWVWFYPAVLALHGFFLSWGGSNDQRVPYGFFALTILTAWLMVALRKLYVVDPWPVSRRLVLAVLILPMLAALTAGYGVGAATRGLRSGFARPLDFRVGSCCYEVHVPVRHWELASTRRPPEIGSPWGESFEPKLCPLARGARTAVYNPYDSPFGSSPELVALQISRAVEAVYGQRVPYETIRDRYFATGPDGKVMLKEGFTLLQDFPGLEARPPIVEFPVALAAVGVPWLLLAAVAFRARRTRGRATAVLFIAVFVVIALLGSVLLVTDVLDLFEHWVLAWSLEIAVSHLATSLPGGTLLVWTGSLAALAAAYSLAQMQFRRVEADVCRTPSVP